MKLLSTFLIAILLLQVFAEGLALDDSSHSPADQIDELEVNSGIERAVHRKTRPRKINCNHACSMRCRKASRNKLCKRACNSCCARCHCVPPGTYGNRNVCPCYARLRTKGNRLKCP